MGKFILSMGRGRVSPVTVSIPVPVSAMIRVGSIVWLLDEMFNCALLAPGEVGWKVIVMVWVAPAGIVGQSGVAQNPAASGPVILTDVIILSEEPGLLI